MSGGPRVGDPPLEAGRAEVSARRADSGGIVVIGLGRFGCHLAGSLTRMNREVLAIDRSPAKVQRWSAQLDRVVQADATEEGAAATGHHQFRAGGGGHRGLGGGECPHRVGAGRAGCAPDLGAGDLAEARQDPGIGGRASRDLPGGGDRGPGRAPDREPVARFHRVRRRLRDRHRPGAGVPGRPHPGRPATGGALRDSRDRRQAAGRALPVRVRRHRTPRGGVVIVEGGIDQVQRFAGMR